MLCWPRSPRPSSHVRRVSNPFIAGQCSAATCRTPTRAPSACFKPLHCGAMLCWHAGTVYVYADGEKFQTPSLRGNALLTTSGRSASTMRRSFKPLHCGAMLCWRQKRIRKKKGGPVSNPFIAGQCSAATATATATPVASWVSNPFIAGQCSAGDPGDGREVRGHGRFKPLHCGAMLCCK